jgi:diadenosine tetraphosphate (Ap4A) HIT family hydrolase
MGTFGYVTTVDCHYCRMEAEAASGTLPPRENIAGDGQWRVSHLPGVGLEGWLILRPRRHVVSVSELGDAEAASLGTWQVRLSRAMHQVFRCQKTYVAQFSEGPGFPHVHFHLMPRAADMEREFRGPAVFGLMGTDHPVSAERMDEIALELRARLG